MRSPFAIAPLLMLVAGMGGLASPKDASKKVDELFARWDRPDVPGCAVGVIRDGKFVYKRGFGSADLDHNIPITPESVFEVGSMSKSFICACLALLMDRGKLSPDDDIRKYVPEMHEHDPPIRVRHLIRCRSGLYAQFHLMQLAGWNIEDAYEADDVLALLAGQRRLPFEPGTAFRYGSSDYFLLGLIIERVSGKPLARFARDNLFVPLKMTRTSFEDDPGRVLKGRVVGYNSLPGGGYRRWVMRSSTVGGWGLKTCVEDLYRWDQNFYKSRLPHGKYLDRFLAEGTLLDNRNVLDAEPTGMYRGLRRMQFTGGMPGFAAALSRFPGERFTAICLSNNNSEVRPFGLVKQIVPHYLGDRLTPEEKKKPKVFRYVALSEKELRAKEGAYRNKHGQIWKLGVKEGKLRVTDHLDGSFPLRPLGPTRFRGSGPTSESTFVFDRAGDEPPGFTLEWEGGKLRFRRVKLVSPTAEELTGYEGEYFSEELTVAYRVAVRGGRLWLRVGNRGWEPLDPTVKDQFIPHRRSQDDNRILTFKRDDKERVVALEVDLWRIKEVQFRRRPPASPRDRK